MKKSEAKRILSGVVTRVLKGDAVTFSEQEKIALILLVEDEGGGEKVPTSPYPVRDPFFSPRPDRTYPAPSFPEEPVKITCDSSSGVKSEKEE